MYCTSWDLTAGSMILDMNPSKPCSILPPEQSSIPKLTSALMLLVVIAFSLLTRKK